MWQKFYDAEEMVIDKIKYSYEKKWKDVRYTDIIINKIKPDKDNKNVTVIITRKFYYISNPIIHSERIKQSWKYINGKWKLNNEKIIN